MAAAPAAAASGGRPSARGVAGELMRAYLDQVGDAGVERAGHVVGMRQRLDVQQQLHCAHAPLVQCLVVELHLGHHYVCRQGQADTVPYEDNKFLVDIQAVNCHVWLHAGYITHEWNAVLLG